MSERDPRIVIGQRPVNRRIAGRPAATPPPVAPAAIQRARIARVRSSLGAPLAQQLRTASQRASQHLETRTVIGAVVTASGGLGLFLSWLQASPIGGAAGAAALAAGAFLVRAGRRVPLPQTAAAPLFDDAAVQALDAAIEQLGAELPPEVVQPLVAFKQVVVRMARQPAAIDEHFRLDDRLYVNECLRRYLPDSLQAYLAVPREARNRPLADGQTPQALLLAQLALLQREMEARETRLARGAAEALLRQQRFLAAKKS